MAEPTRIRFREIGPFKRALNARVMELKNDPQVMKRAYRQLHRKALVIATWVAASYLALLLLPHSALQIVLCGASLVASMALLQFNVMHDGNHGAFSRRPFVNKLAGWSLDIVGGYSQHWQGKHNVTHHGYTNIDGWDDDIEQPPFARLAGTQKWRPWHRWQHWYLWPLYGLMLFRWLTIGDFITAVRGHIMHFRLKKSWWQTIPRLVPTKLLAWGWQLALPLSLNWSWSGAEVVMGIYVCLTWTLSCLIVIVFQLAHCGDESQFFSPADADADGFMPEEWMIGQVRSTADFCPDNPLVHWCLGGLNFQIEHHLFAELPHTLYPQVALAVREVCEEFGIPYVCYPTITSAVGAHFRHLHEMARPPVLAAV